MKWIHGDEIELLTAHEILAEWWKQEPRELWISTLPYLPIGTSTGSYRSSEGHLFSAHILLLQRWKLLWCHDQPLSLPGRVPHAHPSFPQAGLEASLRSSPDALCLGSDVLPKVLSIWPYWWAPQLSQWMLTPSIWSAEPGARHSFPSSPPCCSTLSHSVRTLQSICTCLPDTSPPLISTTKV